jgi:hypothetical protein
MGGARPRPCLPSQSIPDRHTAFHADGDRASVQDSAAARAGLEHPPFSLGSITVAFAVGRRYQATDAAKRLQFGGVRFMLILCDRGELLRLLKEALAVRHP